MNITEQPPETEEIPEKGFSKVIKKIHRDTTLRNQLRESIRSRETVSPGLEKFRMLCAQENVFLRSTEHPADRLALKILLDLALNAPKQYQDGIRPGTTLARCKRIKEETLSNLYKRHGSLPLLESLKKLAAEIIHQKTPVDMLAYYWDCVTVACPVKKQAETKRKRPDSVWQKWNQAYYRELLHKSETENA